MKAQYFLMNLEIVAGIISLSGMFILFIILMTFVPPIKETMLDILNAIFKKD